MITADESDGTGEAEVPSAQTVSDRIKAFIEDEEKANSAMHVAGSFKEHCGGGDLAYECDPDEGFEYLHLAWIVPLCLMVVCLVAYCMKKACCSGSTDEFEDIERGRSMGKPPGGSIIPVVPESVHVYGPGPSQPAIV